MYRTVLVSDVLLFADSLSHSINHLQSNVKVVRSFGALESAPEICELAPDLLVISIDHLSPNECLEAVRDVRLASPSTQVAILFGESHARDIVWLVETDIEAHSWSLILRDHVGSVIELCGVLERVAQGECVRIPEIGLHFGEKSMSSEVGREELLALRSLAAGPSPNKGVQKGAQKAAWSLAALIRK